MITRYNILPGGISGYRLFLWAVILVLLLWNLTVLGRSGYRSAMPMGDYPEYWAAGRLFVSGGNPYGAEDLLEVQRGIGWTDEHPMMMWNPPWTLLLVAPFGQLPFWLSRGVWFLPQVCLVVIAADWLWRRGGGPQTRRWVAWLAGILFIPNLQAFGLGQISPLVLFGLVGFLWALSRGQPILAGCFTILVAIKPHMVYLFWVFLCLWAGTNRRWKVILGSVTAHAASLALVALINPQVPANYLRAMLGREGPLIWETPTWGVALLKIFPHTSTWLRFLPMGVGLIVSLVLWQRWKRDFSWERCFPTILLLSIMSTCFTWTFDWVVLLPVVVMILIHFQANPLRNWWLLMGLVLMEVGLYVQFPVPGSYFHTIWMPPALAALYFAAEKAGAAGVKACIPPRAA